MVEQDFNSEMFKLIPENEQKKIFNALKEQGIIVKEDEEAIFDVNGFTGETRKLLKLYNNGNPIDFSSMSKIISAVKEVLNNEEFWIKSNKNSEIDNAKNIIYQRFMKLRNQELKNINNSGTSEKSIKLKIKQVDMTDIKHSLFLGNHAACCTAIPTGLMHYTAPTYIMNRLIGAIEIVNGKTSVGNSMIYIAEVDGIPSLILDNIEISGKYQYNDDIRDALFDYVKQFVKEIGKPDMPVYVGPYRNKINMPDTKSEKTFKIIGSSGEQEVYIDSEGDFKVDGTSLKKEFYKIK